MLALSRKPGEKIIIGNGITVTVVEVRGNGVRLAVEAPEDVPILRGELACWQDYPRSADLERERHEGQQAVSNWDRTAEKSRPRSARLSARSAHGATRRANEHNQGHAGPQG
jgi:carbon storage regulator